VAAADSLRPIAAAELAERRRTVAAHLADRGLQAAVLSDPANVRYLGGFALTQPWMSRTRPTVAVLDADGRLTVVASTAVALDDPPVDEVVPYTAPPEMPDAVADLLARRGLGGAPVATERGHEHRLGMTVAELEELERLHTDRFEDAGPSLWAARIVKSPAEIDRLRAAFAACDRIYARLFAGELRAGESERELARRISRMMLEEGADEPGWVMLTSGAGSYGRLLSTPRQRVIERGEMVWLDLAARVDGYWSDHSRAGIVGGEPTAEQVELQSWVVAATQAGIAAVRPGVALGEVAAAATLAGESVPGRVGHGVGLATTEPPDVVTGSDETAVPGMVFTIEPLAVREYGMFQAEAVLAVTDDGCELLTHAPEAISAVPG